MESVINKTQIQTNKVNELCHEAQAIGRAPGNYCKVQILGDERAGKTSLWKKLMGKPFDPEEPSTFGIDTQMCRVKDVDKSWQEKEYKNGSEVADCIVWMLKNKHLKHRRHDKRKVDNLVEREPAKSDYGWHLLAGFCILVLLIGVPEFVGYIGISNCIKLTVAVAFGTLICTKNVQMYLTVKNVADAIFTTNLIGGIIILAQLHVVPNFALGILSFYLAMERGLVGVCQVRMGQSVVLGTIIVCYTSDDSKNLLIRQPNVLEHCICLAVGALLATVMFSGFATFLSKVEKSVYTRRSLTREEIGMTVFLVICCTTFLVVFNSDLSNLFIVAFCATLGDEIGITMGHRLTISKFFIDNIMKNRRFWLVPAVINGWIHVKLCHDSVQLTNGQIAVNIVGLLPLVLAEWYRNQLHEYTSAALDVARKTEETKETDTMPLNLSLWDFAGQDFYYNTHHTFMSAHAVYIIVFDLEKFQSNRSRQIERIRFWVDSVRQHSASSVLLVGTHRDCIDDQILQDIHCCLKDLMWTSNLVFNKGLCFFTVDNTAPLEDGNDDIGILREKIHIEESTVKHLSEEYPIKWRTFGDFIKESVSATHHLPYVTVSELQKIVNKNSIQDTAELLEMLTFFHENGDIIYDSVDSVLRQFVILNPQVMIDIMQALVVVPESHYSDTKFRPAWERFDRTGFLEHFLLKRIISSKLPVPNGIKEEHLQVMIGMLQAKDLICKVEGCKQNGHGETYIVPSKLPEGPALSRVGVRWNKRYYINFGTLLPDAVFFRLICRCLSYSDIVSCGPDQCMVFKEGGLFTLGQNFLFMLRKQYPCKKQCVVEVSVKPVHTATGCCLEVLKYVCQILETLRCRDFRNLRFQAGPLCFHEAPHQNCEDPEMLHILDVMPQMESEELITTVFRQCNGRPVRIDLATMDVPYDSNDSNDSLNAYENVVVSGSRSPGAQVARYKVAVTESDLLDAIHILRPDDLKKLFYSLDMKQKDVEIADRRNGYSGRDDILAVDALQKWRATDGSTATRQTLLSALRSCGNIEAEEELSSLWSIDSEDTLSTSDFFDVVDKLRPWDLIRFVAALGVKEDVISNLSRSILGSDFDLQAMQVFQKWKKTRGTKATRQAILNGLRRCNNAAVEEELLDIWNKKDMARNSEIKLHHESSPELGQMVDVYLSFSQHDEGWVLETLVRYLRQTPNYFKVYLNHYDTATHSTDPQRHISGRQQNSKQIASCKVFIAVNSRHYVADQTGRLKFEREVARCCNVPILVVTLTATTYAADLFDAESVSFSKRETGSSKGECLDLLLNKISEILGF